MSSRLTVTLVTSISALAIVAATGAHAQRAATAPPAANQAPPPAPAVPVDETESEEVVVTGIRESLQAAADIKRDAVQVVDSIVAQDIGKLPDPTTAAALQRVPGIQVSVDRNNELGDVRVRGLPDVLTTVNGRETFTTTGRRLNLQDLPAEALARVDVYKSQTPDLIEGGLAGVIDLKLNKPFSFRKPTAVISARGNYGVRVNELDPQFGLLLTDRFDTGIGEIGVLVNGTFSQTHYRRDNTVLLGLRSAAAAPLNTPGVLIPNILQSFPEEGKLRRSQMNGAIQWKPTESLEIYLDGLYTRLRDLGARYGANTQAFTTGSSLTDVKASDNCYTARVTGAGQNPTIVVNPTIPVGQPGRETMQANDLRELCYLESATLNNPVVNLTTQARDIVTVNKMVGGGATWQQNGTRINVDASYQTSRTDRTAIVMDIGRRLSKLVLRPDDNGIPKYEASESELLDASKMYMRNSFQQTFALTKGDLFATKIDAEHEFGGIIKTLKVGGRFAKRSADSQQVFLNTTLPGGNIGTPTEATARLVSSTGLPAYFLASGLPSAALGGARFMVPNPSYILSDEGLDALRRYVGLPTGTPDFQIARQFNADEKTWAGYGQLEYEIPLGGGVIDGVLGGRFVSTDRTLETQVPTTAGGVTTYTPTRISTNDRNFLPTATARLKLDNGIQARLGYTQSIRRPEFGELNPAITLARSNNPFVQSTGSAGNPDLRQQKSKSYDATLEYYFKGGYVALAGYYRQISDRVINGATVEEFDGVPYAVNRPRNLGKATLKGLELSGQYFFDFLPGGWSGFGVQGAFTLADSKIGGNDPLAGNPLQGVSKYNYTAGLLYDKGGLSGRLIYTYRSRYFDSDQTGSISVRPAPEGATPTSPVLVPTLLSYARPAGRLDFNIGYDFNKNLRVDVGGTNLLRQKTVTYLGQSFQPFEAYYDETTYSVGVRIRL